MDISRAAKPRPRSEWAMRLFQPLANPLIRALAALGVNPLWVVVSHTLIGLVAAGLIARDGRAGTPGPSLALLAAALLLQLKTVLDNSDGGLARATGRVTRMGRYLDTVLDLGVNLALFAALSAHGPAPLALAAFAILTLLLSLDHNLERLYRGLRRPANAAVAEPPPGAPAALVAVFEGIYRRLLAPQDRWIESADRSLFRRLAGRPWEAAPRAWRLAWSDLFSTATLVNLGLSSQLLLLGVCLAVGRPFVYVGAIFVQAVYVVAVAAVRAVRFRRWLRTPPGDPSGPADLPAGGRARRG